MIESTKTAVVEIQHPLLNTAWREKINASFASITYLDFVYLDSEKTSDELEDGHIGISPKKITVVTDTRNIMCEAKVSQLESVGLDVTTLLQSKQIESLTNQTTSDLAKTYESLGESRRKKERSKIQTFYETYIGKLPVYASTPDDLIRKCTLYSNLIAVNSRRGSADFIIAGSIIGQYFADSPSFIFSSNPHTKFLGSAIYEFGQVGGVKIFINSQMDNYKIVLGRNTRKGDIGVGFFEASHAFDIVQLPDMETTKFVLRSDDAIVVIPDEDKANVNYYSFIVKIAKRPFWKRWLKL